MTTFNELVADLVKENLLDESIVFAPRKTDLSNTPELPESINLLEVTTPGLLALAEQHDLNLPDFTFLQPENASEITEDNRVKAILPQPATTFHSTQNFLVHQQRRRIRTRPAKKKGTKFCRSCANYMPFYYLNCSNCNAKLTGDLFYYVMLMFSAVIIALFVLFVLSSKTYN